MFWKIYHPDHQDDFSILFGTIHLPVEHVEIVQKLEACIDLYDRVYTETDLSPGLNQYLLKYIKLDDLSIWDTYFTLKKYDKTRAILKKAYQVDIENHKQLRPMVITSLFYSHINDNTDSGSLKLDEFIWQYALEHGKRTAGVETIEEQVRVMKEIPISYDFELIKKWSKNIPKMNRQIKSLLKAYFLQDIQALYRGSSKSIGPLKKLLLFDRNRVMADRLYQWHLEESSFFSFGTGHMGGAKGVLNLLKQKGLIIKSY